MLPALIVRTFRESVKDASHPDNDILVGTGAVYPDVRIPRSGTFGFVVCDRYRRPLLRTFFSFLCIRFISQLLTESRRVAQDMDYAQSG